MKKVIRDGKVAVLYSPGFGAGWSTWNTEYMELLLFDSRIVEAVEKKQEITEEFMLKMLEMVDLCLLGADKLTIEWLPVGTRFYVDEYDGSETIITESDFQWTA